MYEARQNKEKISRVYQTCKQKNINHNLHDSYKSSNYKHDIITQFVWDVDGVNDWLRFPKGMEAVHEVNNNEYSVIKADNMGITRTYADGKTENLTSFGYTNYENKIILLNNSQNNPKTASTFVHEATHVKQIASTNPSKKLYPVSTFELEAHVIQEEFNSESKIEPKKETFRNASGEVLVQNIRKYIEDIYKGNNKTFTDKRKKPNIIETIKPWPTPYPMDLQSPGREHLDI